MINPELAALQTELASVRREVEQLVGALDEAALNGSPGKGEWSIAQQIDHLNKVDGKLLPGIEGAIAQLRAEQKSGTGPFAYSFMERQFLQMMNPQGWRTRIPVPVAPLYEPSGEPIPPMVLLAEFTAIHESLSRALDAADGLDLTAARLPSPVNRNIVFTLGTWLNALVAHDRYHANKALVVRARPDFPLVK